MFFRYILTIITSELNRSLTTIILRSQEKINHIVYMDDIKKFDKTEKQLETLIQTSKHRILFIHLFIGM